MTNLLKRGLLAGCAVSSGLMLYQPEANAAGFYVREHSTSAMITGFAGAASQGTDSSHLFYNPATIANRAAWKVFEQWEKPFLTCFSNRDPITRGGEMPWQERVPGAKDQPHVRIRNAGHFLQEEKGPELAELLIDFVGKS